MGEAIKLHMLAHKMPKTFAVFERYRQGEKLSVHADHHCVGCTIMLSCLMSDSTIYVTRFWKISLDVTLKYIELHNLL